MDRGPYKGCTRQPSMRWLHKAGMNSAMPPQTAQSGYEPARRAFCKSFLDVDPFVRRW